MAGLDAVQFQAFMDAQATRETAREKARGKATALTVLTSKDSTAWLNWRKAFQMVAISNRWDDQRQKFEMLTQITGPAATVVRHLTAQGLETPKELLDQMEARFIPITESKTAIVAFQTSSQGETEDIIDWHSRLYSLFLRAYPLTATPGTDPNLIQRFTMGLRDRDTRVELLKSEVDTYNLALQMAGRYHAAITMDNMTSLGVTVKTEGINALLPPSKAPRPILGRGPASSTAPAIPAGNGKCYYCGITGHVKAECRKMAAHLKNGGAIPQPQRAVGPAPFNNPGAGRGGNRPPANSNYRGNNYNPNYQQRGAAPRPAWNNSGNFNSGQNRFATQGNQQGALYQPRYSLNAVYDGSYPHGQVTNQAEQGLPELTFQANYNEATANQPPFDGRPVYNPEN